jgi:hypothetical protein
VFSSINAVAMTQKDLESNGYKERWTQKEGAAVVACFAKAVLAHPDEQPLLYVVKANGVAGVGFTKELAYEDWSASYSKWQAQA